MAFNLFDTPKLTKPIQVYDPTRSVRENMSGQGVPSVQNIVSAYNTAQGQAPAGNTSGTSAAKPQSTVANPQVTLPAIDPNSATSGMDAVIRSMYTSPAQEEKMRMSSMANQRILALGDALRHIGNIYHTVNYAPSQQFNKPWEEERARYERGKAVRDAANAHYLSYQQAKAAQDAKQKQWEATFNYNAAKDAAAAAALADYRNRTIDARDRQFNANLLYRMANDEANRKQRQGQYDKQNALRARGLSIQEQNSKNAQSYREWRMNGGSGSGSKVAPYSTPKGKVYHNGGNSADPYQMQQLYYKAKEIDDKHRLSDGRFESGYKPLITGSAVSSLLGGSGENYRQVSDALSRSSELADWAVNNLGWSYNNGSSGGLSVGWDDDEEDDGLSIGW